MVSAAGVAASLLFSTSAMAQGAEPALATAALEVGRAPQPPAVRVVVDISDQKLTLFLASIELDHWKVSTGRRGYATPKGVFRPQFLSRNHRSRIYDNAPMPFSVFFNGNVALHGTTEIRRLGKRASHGCVRQHPANAHRLFDIVRAVGFDNVEIVVQD